MNKSTSVFLSSPSIICAAGYDIDLFWRACIEGSQKGITFDSERNFIGYVADEALPRLSRKIPDRTTQFAAGCLKQIESKIEDVRVKYGPENISVCASSQTANIADFIAKTYGLHGPVINNQFSGADSIIAGIELLQQNKASAVIVGGAGILGNNFASEKPELFLGEGSTFFILTTEQSENSVEILGYGKNNQNSFPQAVNNAFESANICAKNIDYVCLNNSNDIDELSAMDSIFEGYKTCASSIKELTGFVPDALTEIVACAQVLIQNCSLKTKKLPLQIVKKGSFFKPKNLEFIDITHPESEKPMQKCLVNIRCPNSLISSFVLGI